MKAKFVLYGFRIFVCITYLVFGAFVWCDELQTDFEDLGGTFFFNIKKRHVSVRKIYEIRPDGEIQQYIDFSSPIFLDPSPDGVDISPDNQQLVVTDRFGLFIYDIASKTVNYILRDESARLPKAKMWMSYRYPKWSPDGKMISFLKIRCISTNEPMRDEFNNSLCVYSLSGENSVQEICPYPYSFAGKCRTRFCWSPDSTAMYFNNANGEIYSVTINNPKMNRIVEGVQPIISPDGRILVFCTKDYKRIIMYDFNKKKQKEIFDASFGEHSRIEQICWSPDGNYLAYMISYVEKKPWLKTSIGIISIKALESREIYINSLMMGSKIFQWR